MLRLSALALAALLVGCAGAPAESTDGPETTKTETEKTEAPSEEKTEAAVTKAEVGKPAPDFTLKDLDGNDVKLSSFKGKTVVLEWFNPGCPFVVHAHGEGPLKDMAKTYTDKGVVWLAVNSGAPGKQGHGVDTNKEWAGKWSMEHPILVDEDGAVGRTYDAKTTPELYVIDAEGVLKYHGALDNAPRGEVKGGSHQMFAADAIDAVLEGKDVPNARNRSYGCSVKYSS